MRKSLLSLTIVVLAGLFLAVQADADTMGAIKLKAAGSDTIVLECTADASGNVTCASTGTGATLSFDDMAITAGSISASGSPTWSLTNSQVLDDGVTDSPYWGCQDATDQIGYIYKADGGHLIIYNDTAGDGVAFQTSGDTDDYLIVSTVSNTPTISTAGTANLNISPDANINLMADSDTDDYVSFSSGSTQVTMGIVGGADLIITHDTDAKGIAFQMGADTDNYLSTYTTSNVPWLVCNGNGDFNIATDHADGEINVMGGGDTSDYFQFDAASNIPIFRTVGTAAMQLEASDDTDDYLVYSVASNVPTITATGDCDFELATAAANYVDISTGGLRLADEELITNASDVVMISADDNDLVLELHAFEAKTAAIILAADQDDEAKDQWKFLANDSATATMLIQNDSAVADTFATVATFAALGGMTLSGTTPYLVIGDNGTEDNRLQFDGDTDYYIAFDTTGGIAENLLTIGLGSTVGTTPSAGFDASNHTYLINDDSTGNAVEDILTIYKEVNGATHGSNGVGAGIVFVIEDAAAAEEQASIDVALTDVTDSGEEADIIFRQNSAGAVGETLRSVSANSATTGDYLKYTSNTTETDGIIDIAYLTTSAVTGAAGMGLGISWAYCDAGGAEQQGSIDNVLTTATNGSEMSDFVFSQQSAGAIAETLRLVAASSATTSDYLQFTANTSETNGVTDVMVLKTATGTATDGYGMGISFQPEDATGSEEVASMDIVETTAARATNDTDFVFSQNVNGTITERVRFDADGGNIVLSGATPSLIVGDAGEEDTSVVFDGNAQDWYVGLDDAGGSYDDDLVIGLGSAVGTTPAMYFAFATQNTVVVNDLTVSGGDYTMTSATDTKPLAIMESTHADANPGELRFNKNSATPADNDGLGRISFYSDDDGAASSEFGYLLATAMDITATKEAGALELSLEINDADTNFFKMFGDAGDVTTGHIEFNQDSADIDFHIDGNTTADAFLLDATNETFSFQSSITVKPQLIVKNTNTDANSASLDFYKDGEDEADGDDLGKINFYGNDDANNDQVFAYILGESTDITDTKEAGKISFQMEINDTDTAFLSMFGDAGDVTTGHFDINSGAADIDFHLDGNDQADLITTNADTDTIVFNVGQADSQFQIVQANVTGTASAPLINVNDDRTGANANETSEATLYIDSAGTYAIAVNKEVYFGGGQTKKKLIYPADVILDSVAPPTLTYNGTAGQMQIASLEFDANPDATGDDICYLQWLVPDGYVVDSGRLNIYWSYDTAETNDDDVVFDMQVNAVAALSQGTELLDAAGSDFTQGDTNIDDGSKAGYLYVTQLNFEVEDIAVDDLVTIKFWVDESECDLAASGTLDIHFFEIEYESTE